MERSNIKHWFDLPWQLTGVVAFICVTLAICCVIVGWPTALSIVLAVVGVALPAQQWLVKRAIATDGVRAPVLDCLRIAPRQLDQIEAFEVGVSMPLTPDSWSVLEARTYIPRHEDEALERLLRAGDAHFVLIVGPAKAGKSRTAFHMARELFPHRRLIAPAGRDSLARLRRLDPAFDFSGRVVWLDDLEDYVPDGSGTGLTAQALREVAAAPDTLVLATMRRAEYEKYAGRGRDIGRGAGELLGLFRTLPLEPLTVLPERLAALNPRFAAEVHESGLGAALAGYAALTYLLRRGLDVFGRAIATAVVDHRRVGAGPASADDLRGLYAAYLPPSVRPAPEAFAGGLEWACRELRPESGVALVTVAEAGPPPTYTVADYLLDAEAGRAVPENVWTWTLEHARRPEDLGRIGVNAYLTARPEEAGGEEAGESGADPRRRFLLGVAERALRRAADGGNAEAMANLGVLLERGSTAKALSEAEEWLRRAVRGGEPTAMADLGALVGKRGALQAFDELEEVYGRAGEIAGVERAPAAAAPAPARRSGSHAPPVGAPAPARRSTSEAVTEAEMWLRRAAEAGDAAAMSRLGILLRRRGAPDVLAEAEGWLRRAAGAGEAAAMSNLAVLLGQQGAPDSLAEAGEWAQRAAAAGEAEAQCNLGVQLKRQGTPAALREAEQNYRRAAAAGARKAMLNLALLLEQKGTPEALTEAEEWLRRAAEGGRAKAMFILGALLEQRDTADALAEAREWLRRAGVAGRAEAMGRLGVLLERDDAAEVLDGLEERYRAAAVAGHPEAMFALGVLLERRAAPGAAEEAEGWFRKAVDAGRSAAMLNLGLQFECYGSPEALDGAEGCYRSAVEAGNPEAMANLGALLEKRGTPEAQAEAEAWFRAAAEAAL